MTPRAKAVATFRDDRQFTADFRFPELNRQAPTGSGGAEWIAPLRLASPHAGTSGAADQPASRGYLIPRDVGDFRLLDRRVVIPLQCRRQSAMGRFFAWVGFRRSISPQHHAPAHRQLTSATATAGLRPGRPRFSTTAEVPGYLGYSACWRPGDTSRDPDPAGSADLLMGMPVGGFPTAAYINVDTSGGWLWKRRLTPLLLLLAQVAGIIH